MKLTGAEIIIECLLEQGVDTVFGYPGGAVLNIYDALYNCDRLRHVLTAHEQGAAHAADGYARATGKTGVCIATSGPGATNLVTGIATAYMDSVPLVAITGNVNLDLLGRDSFQEVDIAGITMPITKHNFIVKNIDELADIMREAFRIANTGRPGPVLVDVPKNITAATYEYERVTPPAIERTTPVSQSDIDKAVELINSSKKPLIYAGGGIIISEASDELYRFAKAINSPVTLSLMGIGAFPAQDESYVGMIGMHGTKVSSLCVNECDLLIAVGARFSDRVTCDPKHFARRAKILHIDIDAAEINKNAPVYHSVIGDAKQVLQMLLGKITPQCRDEWQAQVAEWKKKYPLKGVPHTTLSPQHILEKLHKLTKGDAIVVTDVGQHQIWTAQYYPFASPRTFISSGGLGTMGFGLGAAIGTKIACPDRPVVLVTGDGSFHMNCNELCTAVSQQLPIVILLMNNNALGMVRQWQKMFYEKRYSYTTLNRKTDYVKLAEAYGAAGYTITRDEEVEEALKMALRSKTPVVINCVINHDINVLPMVPAGAPISNPILELDN